MSGQAPWPVRKGIFRSTGHSEYVPNNTVHSPSPVVEIPETPQSDTNSSRINIPINSPVFTFETTSTATGTNTPTSPLSSANAILTIGNVVREIPIERYEVIKSSRMESGNIKKKSKDSLKSDFDHHCVCVCVNGVVIAQPCFTLYVGKENFPEKSHTTC